jgi:hypothetical protein
MGRVYERLGRVLQLMDDLFAELADLETAEQNRQKEMLNKIKKVGDEVEALSDRVGDHQQAVERRLPAA